MKSFACQLRRAAGWQAKQPDSGRKRKAAASAVLSSSEQATGRASGSSTSAITMRMREIKVVLSPEIVL